MTPIRETIARAICEETNGCSAGGCSIGIQPESCLRRHGGTADAVLRALEAEGWRVVPNEPDEAMRLAGVEAMGAAERASQTRASSLLTPRNDFQRGADSGGIMACNSVNLDAGYRAMLAAAPKVTDGIL